MATTTAGFKSLLNKTTILCTAALFSASAGEAFALPQGGSVVGGSASITSAAGRTDINQTSNRAVINWKSFDIGSSEHVNFNQPSSNSVALNRVTGGGGASQIYGKLTANGNVIIVNPQGVMFGKGAQVNVGGLVASTSDVSNDDFMAGKNNFNKPGNANATIQNDGDIKISDTGIAAMVAPNVINNGVIEAKLGKVALASGDSFSVDLYGDGLIKLQASGELKEQLVKNSGKINADGGSVLLTAAAAENAVSSVINMDGVVEANSVGTKNGKVQFIGAKNKAGESTVLISGKIEAKGKNQGEKGGHVEALGNKVAVLKGATIDASGTNGGGTVLVGGDYLGQGETPTASHTVVQDGATINASAIESGNGGRVIVWSDEYTLFDGVIEVLGGQQNGDGGFVETSSKDNLQVNGLVYGSAANGTAGQWLLDPRNVTISSSSTSNGSYSGGTFTPNGNSANINVNSIITTLNNGSSVTVTTGNSGQQSGNITVESNIEKNSGNNTVTLILNAANDIITNTSVDITANAGVMNVQLVAGGNVTFGTNSDVTTRGGNITITSGGAVTLGTNTDFTTSGGDVTVNGTNNITLGTNATIVTQGGDVLLKSTDGGIVLSSNGNLINTNRSQSSSDGRLTLVGKTFSNSAGTDAFNTGSNRWLIYTADPANDSVGGLTADFTRYSCTYGGSCPTLGSGNGFLYTKTPLLNLTINPVATSIVYGSATPNFTYTLSGYQGNDAANDTITGSASFTTPYTQGSSVGSYNITSAAGTLVSSIGYGFIGTTLTNGLTVTAKPLDVSLIGNVTKTYDGTVTATLNSLNYNLNGIYGTDDVYVGTTAGTYNNKNAASGKTVSVSGITLSGTKAGNYTLTSTSASGNVGTINKRALTIAATAANKVYDGNTTASASLSDNRVSGDSLTTTFTAANFANKNAGTGKTVNVTGINLGGADSANYTFNTSTTALADITKRALTVSATGNNKVYNGNATATVNLTDNRVSGDTLTTSYTSANFANKNVGTGKTVSVSGINVSGVDANNYTFNTTASALADITRRALNISATGGDKTYDGNTATTVTLTDDRVSGDSLSTSYTSANFSNKNAGANKTVIINGINLTGADSGNYTFNTSATILADIAKRLLTVTAAASNKVYDGNTTASVTLSDNRVSGDNLTVTNTAANFNNKNVGTGKTVTVSGINVTGVDANNYNFGTSTTTLANITKRALTVSATGVDKVYNGNNTATVTLSDNRVSGDSLTTNYASATFADKNVGTDKTVSVSGISLAGTDSGNYTFNTTASTLADITKRNLIVSATAQDKTYDGNTTATVTLSDNRVSGDNLSRSYTSANFSNKNAGSNKTVTVSGINVTGTDAGNYNFNTTATDTANINRRWLNISADGVNKVYDGNTNATVTLSDDRVSGDNLNTSYLTAFYLNKNAGNSKLITILGIDVNGADAGNYDFSSFGFTSANITKRALTVSAVAGNKVYDGNTNASVTLSDNRVAGDNLNRSYVSANFDNKNAGTGKTVTVSGINISGGDANNYTFNTTATTLANITKRALSVIASGINKVYDGTTDATVTLSDNRVSGDTLTASYGSASFGDKNVGTAKAVTVSGISLAGIDADNYSFNTSTGTTANITKRALTIGATGINKIYDGNTDATVTLSDNRVSGDALTTSYGSASFDNKNAGTGKTVTVNAINLTGIDADNYSFNTSTTTLADITKRALTIGAVANNKVYDGNTDATVTLSDNRVSGDSLTTSYGSASFDNKNAGTGKTVTVNAINLTGTDADNYSFNTSTTTLADITQRVLTVGATANNKTYDGTTTATVTLSDDRVSGDVFDASYTSADFADRNAGNGKVVTVNGISLAGTDADNYSFNTSTTATADIAKRDLNVAANSANKVYGSIDPTLTYVYDPLQTGDTNSIFTGSLTRDAGENVAVKPYAISQGTLSAGDNYNIVYTGADFTIDPASLTVAADSFIIPLGSGFPPLTYQVTGLTNGDDRSIFSGGLSTTSPTSLPGAYLINIGNLAANSNYNLTYVPGVLVITSPGVTINTANQQALFAPIVNNIPSSSQGTVLSIALPRNNFNPASALAGLEPAAGGEGQGNGNLNNLEPAAGDYDVIPLMDCNKAGFDSNPCQI